jgi:hypothetical protein
MEFIWSELGHLGRSARLEAAPGLPLIVSIRNGFLTDSYLLYFFKQGES